MGCKHQVLLADLAWGSRKELFVLTWRLKRGNIHGFQIIKNILPVLRILTHIFINIFDMPKKKNNNNNNKKRKELSAYMPTRGGVQ